MVHGFRPIAFINVAFRMQKVVFRMQKAAFRTLKGILLHAKRPPFAA